MAKIVNAKEMQKQFIKTYLKPTFKRHGYSTGAQGWWKDMGDFFNAIFWINSSYNRVNDVTFWFFVGPALKHNLRDPAKKKVLWHEVHFHQAYADTNFIKEGGQANPFRTNRGIHLTDTSNYNDFLQAMSPEFEIEVIPSLEKLNTLDKWVTFYKNSSHVRKEDVVKILLNDMQKWGLTLTGLN